MDKQILSALNSIADGLSTASRGLRELAAALEEQTITIDAPAGSAQASAPAPRISLDASDVNELWRRLGPGNRQLLADIAAAFTPEDTFDLDDMATASDAAPGSVKARLMNIGRALKSMGSDFTVLWDRERELLGDVRRWRPEAHRVISEKSSRD